MVKRVLKGWSKRVVKAMLARVKGLVLLRAIRQRLVRICMIVAHVQQYLGIPDADVMVTVAKRTCMHKVAVTKTKN